MIVCLLSHESYASTLHPVIALSSMIPCHCAVVWQPPTSQRFVLGLSPQQTV